MRIKRFLRSSLKSLPFSLPFTPLAVSIICLLRFLLPRIFCWFKVIARVFAAFSFTACFAKFIAGLPEISGWRLRKFTWFFFFFFKCHFGPDGDVSLNRSALLLFWIYLYTLYPLFNRRSCRENDTLSWFFLLLWLKFNCIYCYETKRLTKLI